MMMSKVWSPCLFHFHMQCLFVSFLFLFSFPSSTSSLCNLHDSSALLLFKNSFALNTSSSSSPHLWWLDDFWPAYCSSYSSKTESWKNGTDCCEWDGVTCDTISGHVIALDLSCSYLQGQFHPNSTLFKLRHLQQLNLAYNDFYGSSLYSGIGDLVNLMHLNFSNTGMTGDIPSTISHLSKLVSLDLGRYHYTFYDFPNYLRMRVDGLTWKNLIENATNLRELSLDGVDMSSIGESSLSLLMNLSSSLFSLTLSDTKLQGNLSSHILYLPNLKKLRLSYNENLKVELPKSNWTTPLRFLGLSFTDLSGHIPNSIGHLKSLEYLLLSNCNLEGLIPSSLFNLTQLSDLDLSDNKLVGPIPSEIDQIPKLRFLRLFRNMLNGTIPRWCYSSPSLSLLDLGDNYLTGSLSELLIYSLKYLYLSGNKLQGNFPNSIFELGNLTGLDLSSNVLSGHVDFHQFSKLKNLFYLDLSDNSFLSIKFEGSIPKWKNMFYIDLSFNKLQGDLPIPHNGIQYFLVSNNELTGDIPSTICNASSLIVLDLAHNNLTGLIPQCLATFHSLSVLDLQKNNLYGNMPLNFSEENAFETINLNGNQLEGPLPQSLAHCTRLEVLDLGNNNIEDTFPHWLETLPELQVLSLPSNKFHGVITCFGTKHPFPSLRIFDVSNNNFSGPLPASCIKNFQGMMNVNDSQTGLKYMGNHDSYDSYNDSLVVVMKGLDIELLRILTTFTTIDLSNNMFEGEIPEVMGGLHSLVGLNLSHNAINGTIPQSMAYLRNLEWLDLSWNQLSGEIPMALTNLNFLAVFNLSENHLEGSIPTSRQFDTFGNDSYVGNPMLCGFPLSKLCNEDEEWQSHSTFHHEESGFGWKPVAVGFACGMLFGMLLGCNVFMTGKPQWLARLVEALLNERVRKTKHRGRK